MRSGIIYNFSAARPDPKKYLDIYRTLVGFGSAMRPCAARTRSLDSF